MLALLILLADPVPVIFETDYAGDCDDVGALAALHGLIDRGEAELLMVGVNREEVRRASGPAIDVVNTFYGRGDIPIGTDQTDVAQWRRLSPYAAALRQEFPHDSADDDQLPPAVPLYRRTLAAADDGSVVVISVGGTTNLGNLLKTGPDEFSDLDGATLVRRKVRLLSIMFGRFPDSHVMPGGQPEMNTRIDPAANRLVADRWPTPIIYSGWEVGHPIHTGRGLLPLGLDNPVRRAFELHPGMRPKPRTQSKRGTKPLSALHRGKASYDQTAVLVGVRGTGEHFGLVRGRLDLGDDNRHHGWIDDPDGRDAYLTIQTSPDAIAAEIESLMVPYKRVNESVD